MLYGRRGLSYIIKKKYPLLIDKEIPGHIIESLTLFIISVGKMYYNTWWYTWVQTGGSAYS